MNKADVIDRLCGGTFFTMMLNARKVDRNNVGLTQNHLLKELIMIYDQSINYVDPMSLKTVTSLFKNCAQKYKCDFIRLGDTSTKRTFENRFHNDYNHVLEEMESLCDTFFTKGNLSKSELFIKDLLEVIWLDDSIEMEEKLYIGLDGEAVAKKDLGNLGKIYFPSVVLGVWHFICTKRTDNSIGIETIARWKDEVYAEHTGLFGKIEVFFERPEDCVDSLTEEIDIESEHNESEVEPEVDVSEDSYDADAKTVNQILNTSAVINQYAEKILNIGHVEHLEI